MTEARYNVYIIHSDSGTPQSLIGENLTERQADRREATGDSRCNDDYTTISLLVGCKADEKLQDKLLANGVYEQFA